jgi:hypothetical protein
VIDKESHQLNQWCLRPITYQKTKRQSRKFSRKSSRKSRAIFQTKALVRYFAASLSGKARLVLKSLQNPKTLIEKSPDDA